MNGPGPGSAAFRAAQAQAQDVKRPLYRQMPPPPSFPVDALGLLAKPAMALQELIRSPLAMCGQSALGVATLAVQPHCDIELPGSGRRPLTALLASIAVSGERKTATDTRASVSVLRIEAQWRAEREKELQIYSADLEAWKAARENAKKTNKGKGRAAIRQALLAIGPEPKQPPHAMLLADDITAQGLVLHLQSGRPWCGAFSNEGGVLVGGHAFTAENVMHTASLLNKLWDGASIRRLRVITGNAFLPGRRCSAHLMMQPMVADQLLGNAVLDGIGTLARMLVVEPETTMGTRMHQNAPDWCENVMAAYNGRIFELLELPPRMAVDETDVLDPRLLTLTPDAERMSIPFHDAVEKDIRSGGPLHSIAAFGAKLAEHAGRLAAVLTVYADPDAGAVGAEAMECGITLAQHYAAEMLRLVGGAAVDPDLQMAQRLLLGWQARSDPAAHLAEIYQYGPHAISTAATARRIVDVLEEHGWIRRLKPGTALGGMSRRDAWVLVP
jgi:hypothetical protein